MIHRSSLRQLHPSPMIGATLVIACPLVLAQPDLLGTRGKVAKCLGPNRWAFLPMPIPENPSV